MTAYSESDLSAKAAPARCRRCWHVVSYIGQDNAPRFTCTPGHVLLENCGYFVALPDQREAVVAKPVAGQVAPDCQLDTSGENCDRR